MPEGKGIPPHFLIIPGHLLQLSPLPAFFSSAEVSSAFPTSAPWDPLLGKNGLHSQPGHLGHEGPEGAEAPPWPLTWASEGSHIPGH